MWNNLIVNCITSSCIWNTCVVCGNKMPTRCNRWFLLQILSFDQHVSGTTMPITRSSRVLYRLLLPVVVVPETCSASNKICNKNHLLHLVGILFPHINDDARSKPHQICTCVTWQGIVYKIHEDDTIMSKHEGVW